MRSHTTGRLDAKDEAWKLERGRLAEAWFARLIGGTLARPDQDKAERWDVRSRDGQRFDVKSIEPHHEFIDGGNDRPLFPAPIVDVTRFPREYQLLGIVEVDQWEWGRFRPGFKPCWFVPRNAIWRDWPAPIVERFAWDAEQ
jgi:hypothetical protein